LVSVELLQDSSVNLPQFLGAALGTRIGRITNDHFTTGTGSGQPQGIVTGAANSSITTAASGAITYNEILSVFHSIDPAYRANATWMCNDAYKLVLHKLVDGQSRPMLIPSLNGGEADTILGRPLAVNQSMASGTSSKCLIFGDLSTYYIREVKQIELMRLDELYASSHQVAFLAFARYDGKIVNAGTNPVKYLTANAT
jgi:HK97 family phage major capsid protein